MKQFIALFISLFFSVTLAAQEQNNTLFENGVKAFKQKDYEASISIFSELLKTDSLNATLHYNLGSVYLKNQQTGLSIYHLEKALKLRPNYEAAQINLQFANKLKTNITKGNLPIPQQQMVYSVFNFISPNSWAYVAIGSMLVAVALCLIYLFITKSSLKKVSFGLAILSVVLSIGCFFISKNQSSYLISNHYVIVNSKDALLMNEPRNIAKVSGNLIEGEKAFIKEETDQWIKIQLPNDTIGWVEKKYILKF